MARETTITKIISVFMPELVNEFNIRELAKRQGYLMMLLIVMSRFLQRKAF